MSAEVRETEFEVPKMDCPSEERVIRMALQAEMAVQDLTFDLDARRLVVRHVTDDGVILARLEPLGFGARIVRSESVASGVRSPGAGEPPGERRVLRQLLGINAAMFVIELGIGLAAESTGVLADAVDMFADAAVYGLSLYAVGRVERQRRAATASGVFQLLLAVGVLVEVARRAVFGSEPIGPLMVAVSFVALVANVACMGLLSRHRTGGVHMKASWIFSTNDVIANIGVIVAGVLVVLTGSAWPDLAIGALIGIVVMGGATRILRVARS